MPLALDLLHDYQAFSANHFLVVVVFALVTAIACAASLKRRGAPGVRRAEHIAAWVMLAVWVLSQIYWLLPANFDLKISIPIHMCDLTGLLAPVVLFADKRLPRTLLYFLGLGLSIHGVLTPILDYGPTHITYYFYWITHTSIIGTAVYDVIARGYRPTLRDCLIATGACVIWLGVCLAVNLPLGLNYGYVGNVIPERPTVIDSLGPWPLRLYKMIFAVIALFLAMWLPWAIATQLSKRKTDLERTRLSSAADR